MKNECMGLINLDSIQNPSVNVLSDHRPVATIPIAGRYRLIDFTLSNMVNSGITNVGIYAKEKSIWALPVCDFAKSFNR